MIGALRKHTFGEPPPPKKKKSYHESQIQQRLVEWLREQPNWMVMQLENAARRTPAQVRRAKALGMHTGAPDLVLMYKRWPIFLELKDIGGDLSNQQEQCHAELRARGVIDA